MLWGWKEEVDTVGVTTVDTAEMALPARGRARCAHGSVDCATVEAAGRGE